MPTLNRDGVTIHYEEHGEGYPLLLFAPGGMDSRAEWWERMPFNPVAELSSRFRVIAMDQRNAGRSFAPLMAAGWAEYAADHLALLDHLGIQRTHIMGGCIGSSYCLGLIRAAGDRVSAAVLQNPIGLNERNRHLFQGAFDQAAAAAQTGGMNAVLAAARETPRFTENPPAGPWGMQATAAPAFAAELEGMDPDAYTALLRDYSERMFGGGFVGSVDEEFVRGCTTPLLILAGDDDFHPRETAERIAALAPNAELIYEWREPEIVAGTVERVRAFLERYTPES